MSLPSLPKGAAYLKLANPARRNALSFQVLQELKAQLIKFNTSRDGHMLMLPERRDRLRTGLPRWLRCADVWQQQRGHLPKVLVLRSGGPVFSSGHDLKEMKEQGHDFTEKTFSLCAEVMSMIKSCPIPIVCPIQGIDQHDLCAEQSDGCAGLATAAGFQLAMCTDYPIALADVQFQLPGMTIGLPCTSPATAVSRRVSPAVAYRMFMTGEPMRADQLQEAVDVVRVPEHAESTDTKTIAFEQRIKQVVQRLVSLPAQPQAFGKWAFWTQLDVTDGSEMEWAGKVMVQHSASADAREGIAAFLEKRKPIWQA
jgi:enoyl-CoA hydratase/carnithine racemase